jgi:hypothetical protein
MRSSLKGWFFYFVGIETEIVQVLLRKSLLVFVVSLNTRIKCAVGIGKCDVKITYE